MGAARAGVWGWVRTYLLALVVATAVCVAGLVGVNRVYDEKVDDIQRVPGVDVAENTDPGRPANFLLIGSDTRAFVENTEQEEAFGDPETQTGQRSDTIMVAQVDPEGRTGLLVSFPRDLLVDIPNEGRAKINAAYNGKDGPNQLIATLDQNFGIPIHHYVEVDFSGFAGIVDAVGGVPVAFDAPARDRCTGFEMNPFGATYPEVFVLDGTAALAYVRSRHYEEQVGDAWVRDQTSDVGRVERQQEFVRTLAVEAVRVALQNPLKGNRIANETLANVKTDESLGRSDIDKLIQVFRRVDPSTEEHLQTETFPWRDAGDNVNLLPNLDAAGPLLARLAFLPVAGPPETSPAEGTTASAMGGGPGTRKAPPGAAPARGSGTDPGDEPECD